LRFQFSMHLKFWIIYNWKSYVLFRFELWYHVLLHFLHVIFLVVFVMCVVNMTMKRIFLKSVTRFMSKSKPKLL
jgi:hypothetical protein